MTLFLLLIISLVLSPVVKENEGQCRSLIALHTENGQYYLIDGETYEVTPILPGYKGISLESRSFDWSPDGKRLLLNASDEDGNYNLYIFYPATQHLIKLPEDGAEALWSPDGQYIIYRGGIYFRQIKSINLQNMELQTLLETDVRGYYFWFTQSPFIFIYDYDYNRLFQFDLNNIENQLPSKTFYTDLFPIDHVSLDEKNILYLYNWDDEIFTFNVDDLSSQPQPLMIPDLGSKFRHLYISPDGTHMIMMSLDTGTTYLIDTKLKTHNAIEAHNTVYWAEWSPDSKSFVYPGKRGYSVHYLGAETIDLNLPTKDIYVDDWAPDSQKILFHRNVRDNEGHIAEQKFYVFDLLEHDLHEIWVSDTSVSAIWSPCLDNE